MKQNDNKIKTIFIGILFILLSTLSGSSFDTITKFLTSTSLKWYHYYSLGNSFALIIFLIYLYFTSGIKNNIFFKKKIDYLLPLIRGLLFIPIPIFVFYSLKLVPLNIFTALIASTPFFVYIFSVLIQKEKITLKFWFILLLGFIGANLIVKPSLTSVNFSILLVIIVVVHNGWTNVIVSKYSDRASTNGFTFYFILPMTIVSIVIFCFDPIKFSFDQILLICLGGLLIFASIFFWTAAFHLSGKYASIISPFIFAQIIWGTIYGYFFYNEIFDLFSILGILLIVISGIITILNTPKIEKK